MKYLKSKLFVGLVFMLTFFSIGSVFSQTTTQTFNYTGTPEYFVVPPCVTSIDVVVTGAQGGGIGGLGAQVSANIPVTPGDVLEINVGGAGTCPGAGYNGGGSGQPSGVPGSESCGGGGASDIRFTPYNLADRFIVAAGGGGMGGGDDLAGGGNGGCATGTDGTFSFGDGGLGGTPTAGGTGGAPWTAGGGTGGDGGLGFGGDGGIDINFGNNPGGGGGGGYYGGGGGGSDNIGMTIAVGGGGGGGGSSLTPGGGICTAGVNAGDGIVTITYTPATPVGGTISGTSPICDGDSSELILTGFAGTLQWESAPTSGGPFTPIVGETNDTLNTGALSSDMCYRVEVTNCGTTAYSDTFCVVVNPLPTINAGVDQTVCDGQNVTLNAINPDGAILNWSGGVIDGIAFVPPTGTTTEYIVTADLLGCISTDTLNVTSNPYPVIDAGIDQTVCLNDMVTLTAINPDGAILNWSGGVTDGVPFTALSSTTYTVTADLLGCISTDDVNVIVNPLPIIEAGPDQTLCDGVVTTVNGLGGVSYNWNNGVTDGIPFTPPTTDTYVVTGTDANGCQNTDSLVITVILDPIVNFVADSLIGCDPFTVTFTNLSTPPGSTCEWEFGDGYNGTGCGVVSHTYNSSGFFDVTLTVTLAGGCNATTTYPNYIEVLPQPNAQFTIMDPILDINDTEVNLNNSSLDASSYIWNFGDGSPLSNVENPTHTYPTDPNVNYNITLIASNHLGCSDSLTRQITVSDVIVFYIPNAFTPDGDEHNQTFQPVFTSGYDPSDFHLTIYNRWGEIMFESYNASVGWDGTFGGELVPDGVYVWTVEFKETMSDKRHTHRGHVTVLK